MTNIFFKHGDLFFRSKFIFGKNQKFWLPFKNKFKHRRKIGLEGKSQIQCPKKKCYLLTPEELGGANFFKKPG